ncbi:hypothetical protein [Pseudarthrobacter sp. NBSH8]|nr:hypothetical protein [Pseudarthrobacter sp. NBSH8]
MGNLLNIHAGMAHSPAVIATYFNHCAGTELDLPAVPELTA